MKEYWKEQTSGQDLLEQIAEDFAEIPNSRILQ